MNLRSGPQVHCFSFHLQSRGRVGRSGREGFTYLFHTDKSLLSRIAMVSCCCNALIFFCFDFLLLYLMRYTILKRPLLQIIWMMFSIIKPPLEPSDLDAHSRRMRQLLHGSNTTQKLPLAAPRNTAGARHRSIAAPSALHCNAGETSTALWRFNTTPTTLHCSSGDASLQLRRRFNNPACFTAAPAAPRRCFIATPASPLCFTGCCSPASSSG